MTSEVFANSPIPGRVAAIAVLAGNGGSVTMSATSFNVKEDLPGSLQSGGQFHALIDQEIVVIPCQAGVQLTGITRAASAESVAASHRDGAAVYPLLTAEALQAALTAIGTASAAAVAGEASRAETAETGLSTAETGLSTAVSSEATRAQAAEAARILASSLGQPSGPAKVGSDGYVGGTAGTPLSPSVENSSSLVVAMGAASGTDDTTALQGLLSGIRPGQVLKGRPGEHYKYTQLRGPAGGGFEIDMRGCTVERLSGHNFPGFVNDAAVPLLSSTDGAMTAGTNVLHTALAANAQVGQAVAVQPGSLASTDGAGSAAGATANGNGPGPAGFLYYGTITAVDTVDSTVTIAAAHTKLPLAQNSGSGWTVWIFNRDSDIVFRGGHWVFHGTDGTGWPYPCGQMSMVIRRVDRLLFCDGFWADSTDQSMGNGKGLLHLGDCTDWVVDETCRLESYSDALHTTGPQSFFKVLGLQGKSVTDDYFAQTATDWPYVQDTCGDITDGEVHNIMPKTCAGSCYKLSGGGGGSKIRRVKGDGFRGTCTTFTAMYLGDGQQRVTMFGSDIADVELLDIGVLPAPGLPVMSLIPTTWNRIKLGFREYVQNTNDQAALHIVPKGDGGRIEVDGLSLDQASGVSGLRAIAIFSNHTIDELVVSNLVVPPGLTGQSDGLIYLDGPSSPTAVVNHLRIVEPNIRFSDSLTDVVRVRESGTSVVGGFKVVSIVGGHIKGAGSIFRNGVTTQSYALKCDLTLSGGAHIEAASQVVTDYGAGCDIHTENGAIIDSLGTAWASLKFSSAEVLIDGGKPVVLGAAKPAFVYASGATNGRVDSFGVPADITTLAPVFGDKAYNTKTGQACGLGPVVWTGQAWKGEALSIIDRDNGRGAASAKPGIYLTPNSATPNSAAGLTSGRMYLVRFVPSRSMLIKNMVIGLSAAGSADTGFDVGIYNAALTTLLGSWGLATANQLISGAAKTYPMAASIQLVAGTPYYASMQTLTFTGTPQIAQVNFAQAVASQMFSASAPDAELLYVAAPGGTALPAGPVIPTGVLSFGPAMLGLEV